MLGRTFELNQAQHEDLNKTITSRGSPRRTDGMTNLTSSVAA